MRGIDKMRKSILFPICAWATAALSAPNVTNTVMMVDQRGNLNVDGVASVAEVATNAVKVQIAEAKAAAAQETARGVTSAIGAVVENIMSNNVVVYRSGFSDSFAALVIFTENDALHIVDARWREMTASRIVVDIDYVSTADFGTVKPIVYHHNTVEGGRENFEQLADTNVTAPIYHAETVTFQGQPFTGYYTITATIPNPESVESYFLWIKAEADAPSGDGTTLDLPNGVTGGVSGDFTWGDKVLTFQGGVLKGVRNVE